VSTSEMEMTTTDVGKAGPHTSRPRLEVLDGLRLLAAAYVVVFHFAAGDRGSWHAPSRELFTPLFHLAKYGWLGVELFFMISGFVICLSGWGKSVRRFLVARFVRLYPAYWVAIALTTIVLLVDQSRAHALPWHEVLRNLTMTESFAQVPGVDPSYWTLAIELMFYLVVAVTLAWWGFTYRRVIAFCSVWLGLSLLDQFIDSSWYTLVVQPIYAPFFVAGIVLFLLHRFGPSRTLWALLGASWFVAMYRLIDRTAIQHPSGVTLNYWVSAAIVTGFYVLLTLIALGKLSAVRGRWLVTAGALTYPLYLLHQNVGETLIRSLDQYVPSWVLLVVALGVVFGLSYLVQRYAERPLAARIRAALDRPTARAAARNRNEPPAAATPRPRVPVEPCEPVEPHEPLEDRRSDLVRSGP
jgi:peptidoglycan/LPS O-acetylase OafA/YrhL